MAIKILLDAGHYSGYNVSPVNSKYNEGDRMWDFHLLLKTELEAYGITVDTTRSSKVTDKDVYIRGTAGKGYDLVISEHSNASSTQSTDYPVVIVPFNNKITDLGEQIAQTIQITMGTIQSGRTMTRTYVSGNVTYDYYGVIRGAVFVGTPGIIVENSFHTNSKMTAWLLNDANLKALAKAEAKTIANYFGISTYKNSAKITTKCQFYKKSNIAKGSYCVLAKGTTVEYVKDQNNGWSKVSYNGNTGYVKNSCIDKGTSKYKKGVTTSKTSLRTGMLVAKSTDTSVVAPKGKKVTVISSITAPDGRKWCQIKYKINGKTCDCYVVKSKVNME